jgi:hypothetical protein
MSVTTGLLPVKTAPSLSSQSEFYRHFELLTIGFADMTIILSLSMRDPPGLRVLSQLWPWVAVAAELPLLVFIQ